MSTCRLGHSVSRGMESCAECGQDVRVRCSQGHASGVGARFCVRCGEYLLRLESGQAMAAVAAGPPILDYSSDSFTDFIAGGESDYASLAMPTVPERALWMPEQVPRVPEQAPWVPEQARPVDLPRTGGGVHHDVPLRMPGAADLAVPLPGPRRSRRSRVIVAAALVAVFGAGGTAGAFALHRHYAAGITSPARPATEAGPGKSALPSAPTQPARRSGWSSPFPVPPLHEGSVISGMSCPTTTQCYAAVSTGDILSSTPPGGWRNMATDSAAGLVAISCAKKQSCVALDRSGNALVLANGTWSNPSIVHAGSGVFTALSCPTPTFCMAADSSGAAYADTRAGWQRFRVDTNGGRLTGVSCTSSRYCVAVDNGGGSYTYDGRSWTAVSTIDARHAFTAVSCADRSFCAAIDRSGDAAVFTGRKWSVASLGTTALTVACPVSGFCVATNGAGGAVIYRAGIWSRVSVVDGTAAIGSLSCASATFCVAIDNKDQVIYYRPE